MFRICRIIAETKESANNLKQFLGGYPVEITEELDLKDGYSGVVPTLIVGWNSAKSMFPDIKINDTQIMKDLEWTYNEVECDELKNQNFHINIENFVNRNLEKWLPSEHTLFDPIVHGKLQGFIDKNIVADKVTYIHFGKGALYMRNNDNNYTINVKNLWLTEGDYRVTLSHLLNGMNCMIYSHDGIEDYVDLDELGEIRALDIIRWIKYGVETPIKYFQIIPNVDISKYVPFLMSKIPLSSLELDDDEEVFFKRMCVRDKITRWMSTRYVPFDYNFNKKLNFVYREHSKLARINYSTKRTLTGRITSKDRYNPQNLSKTNEDRKMIISKFRNGRIYQFDYTSFETRIALYLSDDDDFIERFYDKDLHSETARIIYETLDFTNEQREIAKLVNHAILYGASEGTILNKLEGEDYPVEKMNKVKDFLAPIFKKSKELADRAESYGYIINKWGSIIKPEKSYAGFNNYIQSTASEIVVDKVIEIKELLKGHRSDFLFQVHDSLVLDIHPDEKFLVEKIASILSFHRGMLFSIDYKSGPNYKELSSEGFYF